MNVEEYFVKGVRLQARWWAAFRSTPGVAVEVSFFSFKRDGGLRFSWMRCCNGFVNGGWSDGGAGDLERN